MNLIRHADERIAQHFSKYKEVLVLLGGRQTGKTTILKKLFPEADFLTVDTKTVEDNLNKFDPAVYRQLFKKENGVLVIDEIHRLSDPGRAAKIIFDQMPQYQLIVTGSSSFRIKNKTSESLAGRKIDYHLYPLTFYEVLCQRDLIDKLNLSFLARLSAGEKLVSRNVYPFDFQSILNNTLVFGSYPAMLAHPSDPNYLLNFIDSVLFKDLLELSLLENHKAALGLLRLLAYQVGSLVNTAELSRTLGTSAQTVTRYLTLFEQNHVVFPLYPFSQNKRDEIGKMPKVYFNDNGLRNALINNFAPVGQRGDAGQLFENFIISESVKYNYYGDFNYDFNYWRTKSGSEIDLVLSKRGEPLFAVEIKNQRKRINNAFVRRYPTAKLAVVDRTNFI